MSRRPLKIGLLILVLGGVAAVTLPAQTARAPRQASRASRPSPDAFGGTVRPFLTRHCLPCHNDDLKAGELDLGAYRQSEDVFKNRGLWERIAQRIQAGEMPPKGRSRPADKEVRTVAGWIRGEFAQLDRAAPVDPGRVTARRLNRVEYNNTVRDLLGVDLQLADDFPADDSGYGFDNIADVLSLSPLLMEKYLAAAEKVARAAIPV